MACTSDKHGFLPDSEEDRLVVSRVLDAVRIAQAKSDSKFIGFLDERACRIVASAATAQGFHNFLLFGGYEQAERRFFGVFPDWCEPDADAFPLSAITLYFRPQDSLTHRDFLGSLMSLGIKRESVGDILTAQGKAVIFLQRDIASYVASQLDKVGGAGVRLVRGIDGDIPVSADFQPISATIASNRLDCVIGALCGMSRTKTAALIESGLVTLEYNVCTKIAATVNKGDKLSIRGQGKFVIDEIENMTRKGRIILSARKYI